MTKLFICKKTEDDLPISEAKVRTLIRCLPEGSKTVECVEKALEIDTKIEFSVSCDPQFEHFYQSFIKGDF
ncbi:MAG TPA: hypothetical protein VMX55_12315 [candidate division Zixibacteria bacterium]|nr:hypothetical protein [candidate division Zixibacteria bacterium]